MSRPASVRIALVGGLALATGLLGALANIPTPTAAAAATPTVPLLTGGLVHVTGTVGMEFHFDDVNKIDEVYGPVDFDTTWLFNGVYPETAPPSASNWPQFPGDDHAHAIAWSPASFTGTFDETDPGTDHDWTQHCDVTVPLEAPTGGGGVGPGSETGYLPAIEGTSAGYTKVCSGDQLGYPGPSGLLNYAHPVQLQMPTQPWHGVSRELPVEFHDPSDGNTYTGSGAATLSCAICVSDIVFRQLADPTTGSRNMTEVPDTGTYDGNIVEITASVHNAAPIPLDVPFTFVDETTHRFLNEEAGTQLIRTQHFAAGETRTLTFDWDTRGTAWRAQKRVAEHKIAVLTQFGGAQRTITIHPKPVVLVHGWNSDASTWGAMKSLLRAKDAKWGVFAVGDAWSQAGMTMDTNPVSGNSIEQNARAESRYVEHVRHLTRAQHVDLVVHSMGGLISRDYIDHMMLGAARPPGDQPLVAHLVMLGTPNRGSACAYAAGGAAALFGDAVPTIQLTPAYVDGVFNRYVRNQHGVKFSVDAGTGFPVCFTGDGDTVVTRDSAWWIYDDVGVLPGDIHTELPGDPTAVDHWVMPHIAKAWFEETGAGRRKAPAATASRDPSGQVVALARRKLAKGDRVTVKLPVTRAKRLVVSLVAGPRVAVRLLRPNGRVAAKQAASSKAARRPFRALKLARPKAGRYRLVLTNTAARRATVLVSAALTGTAATQRLQVSRATGHRIQVRAKWRSGGHPVRGVRVIAYVRKLGGSRMKLVLADDGHHADGRAHDGVYARRTAKLPTGDYVVVVRGRKKSLVRWGVDAIGLR